MTPAPKPTQAPPLAPLNVAPIPQAPPGLTTSETTTWRRLHYFRNQIDAIRNHLQPPGTQRVHLNTLTWLYFNQHLAGRNLQGITENRYASEGSLFSRYSRGQRTEYNMHLATIGFGHVTTGGEQLRLWNSYLGAHNLPEVVAVGTGLPDALRSRDGATQMVAGALTSNSMGPMPAVAATTPVPQAAGGNSIDVIETEAKRLRDFAYAPANEHPHAPTAPLSTGQLPNPTNPAVTGLDMTKDTGTSPVVSTTAAGTSGSGTVVSGGEAPSTAAFEAAPGYSAAVAPPSTPFAWTSALSGIPEGQLIGQVTDVLTNVAVDYDQDLLLALQYRRNDLRPDAGESNTAAIIRLTVRFLHVAGPRASVREALKHLAQEGWDLEGALGDWQSNQNNGAGADRGAGSQVEDEDGQPPRKKLRVEEDDGCEGEEEDDGKKKSKGKGKEL